MDWTKRMDCPNCDGILKGHGGQFGGGVNYVNMRCPDCNFSMICIPTKENKRYTVRCESDEEIDARIKKEQRIKEIEKEIVTLRNELQF